jgi:hypothetical protein
VPGPAEVLSMLTQSKPVCLPYYNDKHLQVCEGTHFLLFGFVIVVVYHI